MGDQRPLVLIVLDGWGVNPRPEGNAIARASTPNMDRLASFYPSTTISISGLDVGLPEGQMGNSEVGHMHLGAGRVVNQDLTLINRTIDNGSFFSNPVFQAGLTAVKQARGRLHLMGLLGEGGVHSHQRHLEALIDLAVKKKIQKIFLHLFPDGRDTAPHAGERFMAKLQEKIRSLPSVKVATLSGRYYAMDRDRRWERTELTYRALIEGGGRRASSALEAIRASYQEEVSDEFVLPMVIEGCVPDGMVRDGDGVIFFNFRADRARQLTRAFVDPSFSEFSRKRMELSSFITMTPYDRNYELPAAFPPRHLTNILGEIVSRREIPQLRIAETEKYAHVTYFFNGGVETEFPLEERILISSAREVRTYDEKPEMSAREITGVLLPKIAAEEFGLVLLNYANADMVGHTGSFDATVRACEVVDECVGRVVEEVLKKKGRAVITSDHGNAEQMLDYETGSVHTAHTANPVPLTLVDDERRSCRLTEGTAIDVAPTILTILGLPRPSDMTGHCLIDDGDPVKK